MRYALCPSPPAPCSLPYALRLVPYAFLFSRLVLLASRLSPPAPCRILSYHFIPILTIPRPNYLIFVRILPAKKERCITGRFWYEGASKLFFGKAEENETPVKFGHLRSIPP
jgi:hypothetical protein